VVIHDGSSFLGRTAEKFDVIILDLTDPEESSKFLFTQEFYTLVKEHLNKGGLVSLQTGCPAFEPHVLGRVHAALKQVFSNVLTYSNFVPSFFVEESYCIATDRKFGGISATLKARNIRLNSFRPEQLENMIRNPGPHITKVLEKEWRPSTTDDPVLHYYNR